MKKKIIVGIYGLVVLLQSIHLPFNIVSTIRKSGLSAIINSQYNYIWFNYIKVDDYSIEKSFIDYQKLCIQLIITTILFGCTYFIFKPRGNNKNS